MTPMPPSTPCPSPTTAQGPARHRIHAAALAALAFLLGTAGTVLLPEVTEAAESRPVMPRGPLWESERATIELFENAAPSVVFISRYQMMGDPFFGLNVSEVHAGTGSGFVWDEQGHIVTNYHVAADARRLVVTFPDQSSFEAEVVGTYADKDLAVLRVQAPRTLLRPLPLGTSADLRVGQAVFAIGNPFGLDNTLTTGIVSALNREMFSPTGRKIQDVIQTDSAINPGNSGGPLLDSSGRLIGVNTMIVSSTGSFAGIGFAVPVDAVNRVVPELIKNGHYVRPGLGVALLREDLTRRHFERGVVIGRIEPLSGAEEAGLLGTYRTRRGELVFGDLILAIDGETTADADALIDTLEQYQVGTQVQVTVQRDGDTFQVPVVLQPVN